MEPFLQIRFFHEQFKPKNSFVPTKCIEVIHCTVILRYPKSYILSLLAKSTVSARVGEFERMALCIEEAIETNGVLGIGYKRIRRNRSAEGGVVVAGVVVEEAAGVGLLAGEGAVGLEVAGRAALRTVGVVRAAGSLGRAADGERGAAEVVAVQVVEVLPRLTARRMLPNE